MSICALIPAFNEAGTIAAVVEGARGHVAEVVVVDDGSSDLTAERAGAAGAVCLRLERNQGKGAAMRHGLAYVLARDFTHVLCMDADGQHRPADIPALIQRARETGADLVIGSRAFARGRMPRSRFFSNTVGSRIASALVGVRIEDSQCGLRLISARGLRRLKLRSRKYEFEMEVLIKLVRAGGAIAHAPVELVYNDGKAQSKMKTVPDTVRICLWSLAFRFLGR